ncbi:hypothetical protein [Salininema proteolyticum]|uniref:Uncharacterized protein n=1 Tax=Salininema proteolyticum TaxID=1607685 RepID=A0ABV8TZB3_9ACTN
MKRKRNGAPTPEKFRNPISHLLKTVFSGIAALAVLIFSAWAVYAWIRTGNSELAKHAAELAIVLVGAYLTMHGILTPISVPERHRRITG